VFDNPQATELSQTGVQRSRIRLTRRLQRAKLQEHCGVTGELWAQLAARYSDEAIIELLMLAGAYRTVSYLVNGLRLPLEPGARRLLNSG
jgi:hypothetical protein